MDLAKAFDKINRYALFINLMNRRCPIGFINILDCWYMNSITTVRWDNLFSNYVNLSAEIRQGGILSPILFSVYSNDVLVHLHSSKYGCFIKNVPFNAFMYDDDLILQSISVGDMQKKINICETELKWLDMLINVDKTSCMRIGNRYNCNISNILIYDKAVEISQEIKYLGVYIISNRVFKCDTHRAKVKYF